MKAATAANQSWAPMELNRAGLSALLPDGTCAQLVQDWLREDCPSFDYGGFVVGDGVREARLLGKSRVSPDHFFRWDPALNDANLS